MSKQILWRLFWPLPILSILVPIIGGPRLAWAQEPQPVPINFKVQNASERMEMTVNTSRILTLDQKIWKAQVNNPDVLEHTPLSPTQLQVWAKSPGVTQVNLFSEDNRVFTVDVIVYGDAQALNALLKAQFPNASLKVIPVGTGVLISGFVDQPEHARLIVQIAEKYYPEVIDAMQVSGVQQVLLHVKVMEVSRTKLRNLGFDFSNITSDSLVASGISGLITATTGAPNPLGTLAFNVVGDDNAFFGVLDALRQDNLMKVLAEPALITVSGRPARFQSGGEFPILVPQSLGTVSIEYKSFGTQLDFVPIVLGNGRIHLDVRPRVSEIDTSQSVSVGSVTVPGLRTREAETGVEMQAGQTLALAGLVQTRVEAENRGLPWVSEVPVLGAAFRRVRQRKNEVELLILVTPELVDAMDAHEVPPCGPGMRTTSPSDWELFAQGHLEVPNCCPPGYDQGLQAGGGAGMTMSPDGMILEEPDPAGQAQQAALNKPQARQNRYTSSKPQAAPTDSPPSGEKAAAGFIGPIGYDVVK